jgi:hypothetical protein
MLVKVLRSLLLFCFLSLVHVKSNNVTNGSRNDDTTDVDGLVLVDLSTNASTIRSLDIDRSDGIVCTTLEDLLLDTAICTCTVGVKELTPYVKGVCKWSILDDGNNVSITSVLTPIPPYVTGKICLDSLKLFGRDFGPICFGFTTVNVRDDCSTEGIVDCIASGTAQKVQQNNIVVGCSATVDNRGCKSCTPCDTDGGIQFDCSNIIPRFTVNKCAEFKPYIGAGSNPSTILPNLILKGGKVIKLS